MRLVAMVVAACCFAALQTSSSVDAHTPLFRYNASVGWQQVVEDTPKAINLRMVSLRHIDRTKSGHWNGTVLGTNLSSGAMPFTPGLQFGPSAMAYISPYALWLIDGNGQLHARFWEGAHDRWSWEEGPLIPSIKTIELIGHSRWLCTSASDSRIFEMSLQIPPWQTVGQPNAQPTAKWSEVTLPNTDIGALQSAGLTFGFSTFFVSESGELWELIRSSKPAHLQHSWRTHRQPPGPGALRTVVALHSVQSPNTALQSPSSQLLSVPGDARLAASWNPSSFSETHIKLMIFCICAHQDGPELWSYNINGSFSAGWLQARVDSSGEGEWVNHGRPAHPHHLTTMPAARIGGVFGETVNAGVFMTTAAGTVVERHWDGHIWQWRSFPRPKKGVTILSPPGGCINDRSMFVVGSDRNVWELYRESPSERETASSWVWVAHGAPSSTIRSHPIVPTRATAMNNKCLFFRLADGSIVERRWSGEKWKWFFHGLPEKIGTLSAETNGGLLSISGPH